MAGPPVTGGGPVWRAGRGGDLDGLGFGGLWHGLFHSFMEGAELVGRTCFTRGAEAPGLGQADLFAQPLDLGLILGLLFLQRLLLTLLFLQHLLPVLLFLFAPGKVCCLAQDQGPQGGHILGDFGEATVCSTWRSFAISMFPAKAACTPLGRCTCTCYSAGRYGTCARWKRCATGCGSTPISTRVFLALIEGAHLPPWALA